MSRARQVSLAAVDLGASSGRVMLGRVSPDTVQLREVHRFRNGPVTLPDGLYWDVLGLYQDTLQGLRQAGRSAAGLDDAGLAGVAVDSWAVDYGLVDGRGSLVGNPRHYRDPRSARGVERVHALLSPAELYAVTGLQQLPFTTVYQLAVEPDLDRGGMQALLIPDLLGYWLAGEMVAEETNASTTGLLYARTGQWATSLLQRAGIPTGLLPPVVAAGSTVGELSPQVLRETGLTRPPALTTVGSHDTASAVVGVPAEDADFAYISCGTWGLVGVELDAPVLTEDSRAANFTNERGVDATIRYLRNVMGLWILSESLRTWNLRGLDVRLGDVLAQAAEIPSGGPRFDPDDPVFLPPGDMPARVEAVLRTGGQRVPATAPEMVRCILDSLATAFAAAVEQAAALSGRRVGVVHLVGGGSQNALLCQLVADASGRDVVAGPVEATALGNLLVQARTHGVLSGDRWSLRTLLRRTGTTRTFRPGGAAAAAAPAAATSGRS